MFDQIMNRALAKCPIEKCQRVTTRILPESFSHEHKNVMTIVTDIQNEYKRLDNQKKRIDARMQILWADIKELFPEIANDGRLAISNDSRSISSTPCHECLANDKEKFASLFGSEMENMFDNLSSEE